MDSKTIQEISEVIQSSNINFLLGAGISTPFLPLLGNIEQKLNTAENWEAKVIQYKKYFSEVMLPNTKVIKNELIRNDSYQQTKKSYVNFFKSLSLVLLQRKSTILSKQINIFTTNIDVLIEKTLEELHIEYNDGFSGKFNPVFSLANFKKSIYQRSLHFDHISEIPVFNIIKIHGSLTWKNDISREKIVFSHKLDHIKENLAELNLTEFKSAYQNILVVNPEESKHLESVLNIYYSELLRLYSSELEKENASLFVLGFSMEDRHIREITLRAAKSNPTLRVFLFCSRKTEESMVNKLELEQHSNIQLFTPNEDSEYFTFDYMDEHILKKVTPKSLYNDCIR